MYYRTIVRFKDLTDDNYTYNVGDEFPREGLKVSKKRFNELSSDKNRRGKPLIEFVEDEIIDESNTEEKE